MATTYISTLFAQPDAASAVKRSLLTQAGIHVHRSFVIVRDRSGFHVDGRFAGEPPENWIALLQTFLARHVLGASREEDSVAVEDAEAELAVGQSALVALIDEHDSDVVDALVHRAGGSMIRAAVGTLDGEDNERFFNATSMAGYIEKD